MKCRLRREGTRTRELRVLYLNLTSTLQLLQPYCVIFSGFRLEAEKVACSLMRLSIS